MAKKYANLIGLVAFVVICITSVNSTADLAMWNTEISSTNPLNWYRFDEVSEPNCIDYGTDGLNGIYHNVALAQDGALGASNAAAFDPIAQSVVEVISAPSVTGDWTVEYIVKKMALGSQALQDSDFTSVRLEGWQADGEVGFALYGSGDYTFTPVSQASLQVELNRWSHVAFRRNADGTQVFINGNLVGTQQVTIELPRVRIGQGKEPGWDHLNAVLDELVAYDVALSDEQIRQHAFVGVPDFIPDDFERYPDTDTLAYFWSGVADVALENSQFFKGSQSMKAQFTSPGSITKNMARKEDYSEYEDFQLVLWLKGDASNTPADITLSILDPNGVPYSTGTYVNGTQQLDWTPLIIQVPSDSAAWTETTGIKIDVGAAAVMYFDNLEFRPPPHTPAKVVEWKFNEGDGKTVADSSGNGFNGTMSGFKTANWIPGGRTGQTGDWAVEFDGGQNQTIEALNVDLSGLDVLDIFKGKSSWTINIWLKIPLDYNISMIGGFGDCDWVDGTGYEDRYLNQWNTTVEFNYGPTGFYYFDMTTEKWQMWTVTYSRWSKILSYYRDGELIYTLSVELIDTTENAFKLGNVGTVVFTPENGKLVALEAQVDDFCIWDDELPWMDDDPETDDVLTLYGDSICYDQPPVYDVNNDCEVNMADLVEILSTWLQSGRHPADF